MTRTAKLNFAYKYPNRKWICTDADALQYGRQLTDTLFEFKDENTEATLVDITEYEAKEIEHTINAYGYTQLKGENKAKGLENIEELYGKSTNWIIAECIFEMEFSK